MADMEHFGGMDAIQADKTERAQEGMIRKMRLEKFLQSQSVLHAEKNGAGLEQGGQQAGQDGIGSGFQANENEIAGTDFRRVPMDGGLRKMEGVFFAGDADAVFLGRGEITPHEEMNLLP
jgi:hypothetical protein